MSLCIKISKFNEKIQLCRLAFWKLQIFHLSSLQIKSEEAFAQELKRDSRTKLKHNTQTFQSKPRVSH